MIVDDGKVVRLMTCDAAALSPPLSSPVLVPVGWQLEVA